MKKKLLFFVNGNSNIGIGHVSRCLIIAKQAKDFGVDSVFFNTTNSKTVNSLIAKHNLPNYKLESFNEIFSKLNHADKDSLLIIDSDDIETRQQYVKDQLDEIGVTYLIITVDNKGKFYSDFILNQNILATSLLYNTAPYTKQLLGPNYFILNESARNITPNEYPNQNKKLNILITFGSADPNHLTEFVIKELLTVKSDAINKLFIIVGPLNKNLSTIQQLANQLPFSNEVIFATNEMYKYMEKSDLAITSLGLTFWELILHKVPSLCISGSEREKNVLSFLADNEYCIKLADYNQLKTNLLYPIIENCINEKTYNKLNIEKLFNSINKNGVITLLKEILQDET